MLLARLVKSGIVAGLATSMLTATAVHAALPPAPGSAPSLQLDLSAVQRAVPADVRAAIKALPRAEMTGKGIDGLPTFLVGDLGRVSALKPDDRAATQRAVLAGLGPVLAAFRLSPSELAVRRITHDEQGNVHVRLDQMRGGQPVVGGELMVHVDRKQVIYAVNGTARGGQPADLGARDIGATAAAAFVSAEADYSRMQVTPQRKVFLIDADGAMFLTHEVTVAGQRGTDPVMDLVYVDADSGKIVAVHPQIHFAENRKVYTANNRTTLPGTLVRSEGGAASSDVDINAAYDNTGATYEAYKAFWNRDSYNNAGATLISSVHYSTNYCNAFWNSSQMVYGDGNTSQGCYPLARAMDVTAHELTHAVTENESGLVYSGESGGMNEALSDIFGAFGEAYVDGGKTGTLAVSSDTWLVGEEILPPALRYMNDPAADGASLDYWTSSAGSKDVHYSSGIANLAFYLLSQGGTHPRGKSSINVTGVGMDKAIRIFYEAQVNIMTSSSNFLASGNATVLAAQNLGYSVADQTSVANAWQAVGVAVPTPGTGGGGGSTVLTNGVPVTGLSDSTGGQKVFTIVVPSGQTSLTVSISGGTGDSDLYTKLGSAPTLSSYDCRPYKSGNSETCTYSNPAAGTYYIMLNAYSSYSGVTLTATYAGGGGGTDDGVPVLSNGVGVTLSGSRSSQTYYKIETPAGKTLTISISGGTGDADLYTKFGAKPTTSSYDCRPYKSGNNETCTYSSTQAGYYYIMLRGYSSYSGLTLKATY